jgi:hypothetical protein
MGQLVAADLFVVPTATYRLLFVLVMLAHDRRRIVHVAVTAHPTAAWTAQLLREAFPWDDAPQLFFNRQGLVEATSHPGCTEIEFLAGRAVRDARPTDGTLRDSRTTPHYTAIANVCLFS